jgi:IS30 family transposase
VILNGNVTPRAIGMYSPGFDLGAANRIDAGTAIWKHMQIHVVTFNNDMGFAYHMEVAKAFNEDLYFTRPCTSQDKETVENRIG